MQWLEQLESQLVEQQYESMAQTHASQEQPPHPAHWAEEGAAEQPALVLHSVHLAAHAAVQATVQQPGMAAHTQVSQEQPPHPLPETALQPL